MAADHFREFWYSNRRGLAVIGLASLAANILLFALPLYSLQIYDRVLLSRSSDTLWLLTLIVAVALVAAAIIDALRTRILIRMGNSYVLEVTPRLFDAVLADSARNGQPSTQPFRDVTAVRGFMASPQGVSALFDAPLVPIFLAAVYLMHVALGHIMLTGIVVLVGLAVANEILVGPIQRKANDAALMAQHRVDDVMRTAEAAEAMGMRNALANYWQRIQKESMAKASGAADRVAHLSALAKGVRMMLSLLISAAGAWYAIHDEITVGAMVASSIVAARGLAPLEVLIGAWRNLITAHSAAARIDAALALPRVESNIALPPPAGRLTLEAVVFTPRGSNRPVIKNASLELPAGAWLGLVGPSAAGKTTLARLLCGVWQPQSGHVRLDGADVFTWNRTDFGRHCGYLPQGFELIAGSVRDNIARFTEADDATIVAAAVAAGCHEMILRLPQGYDTRLGADGVLLSAGQRQRIGLARALYGSPRLIVLDEPNSNLDTEGEQALVQAVNEARAGGATVVMISHRPSLLAGCDRIAVMMEGQIKHFGPRDEILARLQLVMPHSVSEGRRASS